MNRIACLTLLVAIAACAPESGGGVSDEAWIGTITTEGDVTTVINESGSVWGGTATLVEELSIGVDAGEPEYMLGTILHVWDTGDRIFAVDRSIPAVRVYDDSGAYLGDVGRAGQGPGEYQTPWSVGVLNDGRILVSDTRSAGWLELFNADFSYATRWGPFHEQLTAPGARLMYALTLSNDGTAYLQYWELPGGNEPRFGWRTIDANGVGPVIWRPQPDVEEVRNCLNPECSLSLSVPNHQQPLFTLTPDATIVGGVGDAHRFEMRHADDATTVVEHYGDPVLLTDEEWEYWTRRVRAQGLARNPAWRPSWSAAVPRAKPAYYRFYPSRDGNLLVMREGPSRRVEPCTEDPQPDDRDFVACWEATYTWDFFDGQGRYLGAIEPPPGRAGRLFIDGSRFTFPVVDDAGTQRIKRYRLVLPDGQPR